MKSLARHIKIHPVNPQQRKLNTVVDILKKGGVVIYPTDTVYGFGCDITKSKAIEKIATLKGLKLKKTNFSIIFNNLSQLSDYSKQIDTKTFKLLKKFLPGPYTFILNSGKKIPSAFKHKKTIGIRIPKHPVVEMLINTLGTPIVSTSVHDKDQIIDYTTDPSIIYESWKNKVDAVIDSGVCGNIPSTIVDCTQGSFKIIREGKGNINLV